MALDLPLSCALKSFLGSGRLEPSTKLMRTRPFRGMRMQTMPSCSNTAAHRGLLGFLHLTVSTISGSPA